MLSRGALRDHIEIQAVGNPARYSRVPREQNPGLEVQHAASIPAKLRASKYPCYNIDMPAKQPTIAEARRLLATAKRELARADRMADPEEALTQRRQAAEKGWLAIKTAAAAALVCARAAEPHRSDNLVQRIQDLEQHLRPAPGRRRSQLADAIRAGRDTLHGQCFYTGESDACTPTEIEAVFGTIEAGLLPAQRLCDIASRRGTGSLAGRLHRRRRADAG